MSFYKIKLEIRKFGPKSYGLILNVRMATFISWILRCSMIRHHGRLPWAELLQINWQELHGFSSLLYGTCFRIKLHTYIHTLSNLENWLNWMSPVSYFVFILRGACRYCKLFAKIYVYIVIFMNKHTFFIQHDPVICCPEFRFQQKNQPDQRESDFKLLHLCSNHTPHFPINKKKQCFIKWH